MSDFLATAFVPFLAGLLLAILVQGMFQPWLAYLRARARLLQIIMASRQAWTDDRSSGDVWHHFREVASPAAEELLASRLAMPVRLRRTTTFLKIAELVKYTTRKSMDEPSSRTEQIARLDQVLRLLWVVRRDIHFERGVARNGSLRNKMDGKS